MLFETNAQFQQSIEGVLTVDGNTLRIQDADRFREKLVGRLAYNAVFQPNDDAKAFFAWLIREAAAEETIFPASLHELYRSMGKGEVGKLVVPAFRMPMAAYETARRVFRTAKSPASRTFVFTLRPEDTADTCYTPDSYAACILAAAIRERHQGAVFLEADGVRITDPERFDRQAEELSLFLDSAVKAGFWNFELDASVLADYEASTEEMQQDLVARQTGELAAVIRGGEPAGVTAAIGGAFTPPEGGNVAAESLRSFSATSLESLRLRVPQAEGLVKTALGTEPVSEQGLLSFDTLRNLSEVARRELDFGGLSLRLGFAPDEDTLRKLVDASICECQDDTLIDGVLDDPNFPDDIKTDLYAEADRMFAREHTKATPDQDFYLKFRKKALKQVEARIWEIEPDALQALLHGYEEKVDRYLRNLGAANTADLVRDIVPLQRVSSPMVLSGYHHTVEDKFRHLLDEEAGSRQRER